MIDVSSWFIIVPFSAVHSIIVEISVKVWTRSIALRPRCSICIEGLLFHSFPVDQHRFDIWRQTVINHCSQTLSINKHSKICYRHFHPDDYIANHTGLTRYLKATAIPSMFNEIHSSRPMHYSTTFDHRFLSSSSSPLHRSMHAIASSPLLLPSKLSLPTSLPTITDTKTKRLLSTIDKLHQIQNASKPITAPSMTFESEHTKSNEDRHTRVDPLSCTIESTVQNHPLSIDDSTTIPSQQSINTHDVLPTHSSPTPTMVSSSKNSFEDALFKFLERANLLQYYSAFIEQGKAASTSCIHSSI